ncbi:hypothetical protein BDA96_05G112000 [Sorghum bicolor]|uniref:Uncharacterized protein n=2 Tax=Sorghum bicolor TaxID=4558 RepID=A0A921UGC8_SORBI|nr:hypothetical protein BDA96_05G112000 [Sorghum bicolor]OQU83317.1 hypothetical protein SORBI_3005G107250 [Sorghum bicolor]
MSITVRIYKDKMGMKPNFTYRTVDGKLGRLSSHTFDSYSVDSHTTRRKTKEMGDADADSRPRYVIPNEPTFRLLVGPSSIAALLFSHPSVDAYAYRIALRLRGADCIYCLVILHSRASLSFFIF